VLPEFVFWEYCHLHADKLEASLLETLDNLSNKRALYAVWLNNDE
jgi:hypothetical protein